MNKPSSEYVGQYQVNFAVRPVRLGYLIRDTSKEDLVLAMEEASSRWGGITEPILPFDEHGKIRQFLGLGSKIHPVDHFTVVGDSDRGLIDKLKQQVDAEILPWKSAVNSGIHQLFLSAPEPGPALTFLERISVADETANFVDAVTSGVVRQTHWKTWADYGVTLTATAGLRGWRSQLDRETVIEASASQLDELPGNSALTLPAIIWLSQADNFEDAVAFWNLRALVPLGFERAPIVLTTFTSLVDGRLLSAIADATTRRMPQTQPDVFIVGKPDEQSGVGELTTAAGWSVDQGTETRIMHSARGVGVKSPPVTYRFKTAPFLFAAGRRHVGANVTQLTHFQTTSTVIDAPSPITFHRPSGGYIRARIWGAPPLDLPPGETGARQFIDAGVVVDGAIEFLTSPNSRYTVNLKIPDKGALLTASLAEVGIKLTVSDKGQLASGVHARLGDLGALREPNTIGVIKALTTHRIETDARKLATAFPDLDSADVGAMAAALLDVRQVFRSITDIASIAGLSRGAVAPVVERLTDAGFVIRGFKIQCDVCGMDHFAALSEWVPSVHCPGCHSTARVAVGLPDQEMELHYRLNSLVDRASDNGVLGHLLLVAALIRFNPSSYVIPGANLEWPARKCEVDAIALIGPDIWTGEVKPVAAEFDHAQLESDVEIARTVRASGYAMACGEGLPQPTIAEAAELCRAAGIRLWTLEGASPNLVQHV